MELRTNESAWVMDNCSWFVVVFESGLLHKQVDFCLPLDIGNGMFAPPGNDSTLSK